MTFKPGQKNTRQDPLEPDSSTPVDSQNDATIVAIGASAGGIEAVTELMNHLPADTGMAFVLVQHLDPKHHSILTELLARKTAMTVTEVSDGLPAKPNHVYVIPPNATMSISNQTLHLSPREESRGMHMSVDHFMRALAEQKGNRAIGVILSGSGTDGTLGTAEIQAHGGVTFAQDEASAKYDGMPRSAVVAGCVDYVLSPKGIARELVRIARHPYVARDGLSEAQKEFDRRLLTQYAPATVFVNEEMEIIHTRGNVNRYLKLSPGRASLNLLKMAREGLLVELRNALDRARRDNTAVEKRNLRIKNASENGEKTEPSRSTRLVNFQVVPITLGSSKELYYMIVFQEDASEPVREGPARKTSPREETVAAMKQSSKLEQELAATKEYLQSVIETQEAMNEELQSANEEILSSNEELQSTNEEMETAKEELQSAKEELQSANEELTTVNDELRNRNLEVTQINNDLLNLLSSIDIAVIMIGSDLTIRRFTPKAQKFLGLIVGNIGRPLSNINPTIEIADLQSMVLQVVSDFHPLERELTDRSGVHYQFKILPYKTLENKIDGAVITIVDIAPDKPGGKS